MRLRAWRETFLWLAISACGAPAWTTQTPARPVSVFDVPLFANATYIARVAPGDFGSPGLRVAELRGALRCQRLVEDLSQRHVADPTSVDTSCPTEVAQALATGTGFVFVVDASGGRWLTEAEIRAAILPVDTPAKAVLATWLAGRELSWTDGKRGYGSIEDGHVRAIEDGYEVATGASAASGECGANVTNYRAIVVVARNGTVAERSRTKTNSYQVSDPCHPHGRRPADFIALGSDGTVSGLLRRAMHDEAESVRAFERIARELRVHGAPDELVEAAQSAAKDERDHARRCAALLGEEPTIATDDLPVRSLLACALDNAREGCVGETYAALAAVVQAREAARPVLREHFAAIATDELAHAALAHAMADWFDTVLSAEERAIVAAAREAARAELHASLPDAPTSAMRVLGMPSGERAQALLAATSSRRDAR